MSRNSQLFVPTSLEKGIFWDFLPVEINLCMILWELTDFSALSSHFEAFFVGIFLYACDSIWLNFS